MLLLDEPLSALDAKVRESLRLEIRDLQKRLGITTIMVTHDQEEALTMADRIVVMDTGNIAQVGTAREIIAHPANAYVEDFVAHMNPLAVLRAEDMAEPGEAAGLPIDRQTPVREVIRAMTETGAEMLPLQGGGRVTRQGIMSRLVVRRGQAGGALEQPA